MRRPFLVLQFVFQFLANLRNATIAALLMFRAATAADAVTAERYAREIKPILAKRCVSCHGPRKQEGGLRLDTAHAAVAGGDSGAAIVRGKPESSLLMQRVASQDESQRMPPEGAGVPADEQELLVAWIASGAAAPADEAVLEVATDHWAFQPIQRPPLPNVRQPEWCQSPIDRLVLTELEARDLNPSPIAPRPTLLRRLYLDLLGLLPSADEVAAFEQDERPDAIERQIDRLLASPAYGERWGRHWLDQARYADSNGYTRDFGRDIWLYREWVIKAVNSDKPFDQFTLEQFAGDLLPNATLDQIVATGFHRNTLINEEGGTDQEQFRVDAVADRVATTGSVWLGLTLGCARCHNHKYDPISQREFYQLFAFLNTCDEPTIEAPTAWNLERGDLERRAEIRAKIDDLNRQLETRRAELEAKQREWEKTVTPEQRARLPGPVQVAYDMEFEKRDAANKKMIEDYYRQQEQARRDFPLLQQIADLQASEPVIPKTMVMKERAEPRATHIHKRGDFLSPGIQVSAAFPAVLNPSASTRTPPGDPPSTAAPPTTQPTAANRVDLARWLTSAQNPLTPRVVMNRHWQQFFGRGIVETDDDFGTQGTRPTHPALLDWLAGAFQGSDGRWGSESNWSSKRMHRLITTSSAYQQSSDHRADLAAKDPRNDWLGRQSRLRVEAEIVRDAALSASGLLVRTIGGPSVQPPQPEGVYAFTQDPKPWKAATNEDRFRRGMYTFFWRSLPYPMLTTFDAPNANVTCTRRLRSNTPLQALTLANDVAFVECAQALARRVVQESSSDPHERALFAFRTCLARSPFAGELERLVRFANAQRDVFARDPEAARTIAASPTGEDDSLADRAAWTTACRILLNLDEFITRE